jgi:two-component system response regulator CpxR
VRYKRERAIDMTERFRLLLIEDDVELTELMREYFAQHGFDVDAQREGGAGLSRALEAEYDAIILDVMLPILDGFDVLRQIRRARTTPIIMLTARTGETDRVLGLNAGADDYLPKPFSPDELLARIRAVLRRTRHLPALAEPPMTVGQLTLDLARREARRGADPLDLTAAEFEVLEVLMRSLGRSVSRDALSAVVHHRPSDPFDRSLDVHVSRLRRKLEGTDVAIKSIRNVGYQLVITGAWS